MDGRTCICGLSIAGVLILLAPIFILCEPWYSSGLRAIEGELLSLDGVRGVDVRGNRDVTIEDISATIWLDAGSTLRFDRVTHGVIRKGNKNSLSSCLCLSQIGPWVFDVQLSGFRGAYRMADGKPMKTNAKCRFIDIAASGEPVPGLEFDVSSIEEVIEQYDTVLEAVERVAQSGEPITFSTASGIQYTVIIKSNTRASRHTTPE